MKDITPIHYCRSGGPPDDWQSLKVIDEHTGEVVAMVTECDVVRGWVFSMQAKNGKPIDCDRDPPCALCPPTHHVRSILEFGDYQIVRQ